MISGMKSTHALCLAGSLLAGCQQRPSQPPQHVNARIIAITPRVSRWESDQMVIQFQSSNGLIGKRMMLFSEIHCGVGDTVKATAQGVSLTMDDASCR